VTWQDQPLFDVGPAKAPPPKLGEDAARTVRRRSLLAAGIHPVSHRKLLGGDQTCGTCAHCIGYRYARTYWKCAKVFQTHGAATDVRLSWPACVLVGEGEVTEVGDRTEVYEDAAGGWRWRRIAANNEIIADSGEAYTRKADAERAAERVFRGENPQPAP
jgi:uncharacterized protein YegP (UPF0339 family)